MLGNETSEVKTNGKKIDDEKIECGVSEGVSEGASEGVNGGAPKKEEKEVNT